MYRLVLADSFRKTYKNLCARDNRLKRKIVKSLKQLASDPKHPSLKAHKVNTRRFGERWAIWVSGNIRIIWDYSRERKLVILVLSIVDKVE